MQTQFIDSGLGFGYPGLVNELFTNNPHPDEKNGKKMNEC